MGVNPLIPLGIIVTIRVISAVFAGAATATGNTVQPCDSNHLDSNGQCEEPSLFTLVANYALGTIDGAPDGLNICIGVINFIFEAWFVLAVYQLIRGI